MNAAERKISNRRLLVLARFLSKLSPRKFNYSVWVQGVRKTEHGPECGTAGCAMGWAASMPYFQRLGLSLETFPGASKSTRRGGQITLAGLPIDGFAAANRVFGNGAHDADGYDVEDDVEGLFAPGPGEGEFTPKQVAAKIRKFVKAHRP